MRQYIGAVRSKRNILTPLCLFIQTSPNNKAVASGNGNRLFTEKRHVQIANNPRSPQCQTRLNYYFLPDPSHFLLPSTFKRILRARLNTFAASETTSYKLNTSKIAVISVYA
jgi:hypothetical protein